VMSLAALMSVEAGWTLPSWSVEQDERVRHLWAPPADLLDREIAAYRAGWSAQLSQRVPAALARETVGFAARSFWQMTGLMLIGMALFRIGILSAARSARFYAMLALGGVRLGVPLLLYGVRENFPAGWDRSRPPLIDGTLNYL